MKLLRISPIRVEKITHIVDFRVHKPTLLPLITICNKEEEDKVEDNDKDDNNNKDDNNDTGISALGLDRDLGFSRGQQVH